MWQACSASSRGWTRFFWCVCSALSSAVVKLPEEPSPVPAGMSAMLVISRYAPSIPTQPQGLADDRVLELVARAARAPASST